MRSYDLLFLDANAALYRAAYQGGEGGHPLWGPPCVGRFLDSLRETVFRFSPKRVHVVFDSGRLSTRRIDLCPTYKQREKSPHHDENRAGVEAATREILFLCEKLSLIPVLFPGREADDLIARMIHLSGGGLIVSEDQDFYQLLLSPNIIIYHPIKNQTVSLHLCQSLPVMPPYFLLYRALVGDKSDNIAGVPGVGKVTAKSLLEKYPVRTPSDLLAVLRGQRKRTKREKTILEHEHDLRVSYMLTDLQQEVFSHEDDLDLLRVLDKRRRFDPSCRDDFQRLGLFRFAADFERWSTPFQQLSANALEGTTACMST
jgi:DNA polymerase-1